MFDLRQSGEWLPADVSIRWTESGRMIHPQVERAIDAAWREASARLGAKLFDGPMCRLEGIVASPRRLELTLSRTSYKPFLGTNLHNAHLADEFGQQVLANPVGLSTALQSADGWLLLGRRSDSVAYYPGRVHPFAGTLEPHDPLDLFAEVRRELREELSLDDADIADMKCIGLAEDRHLRQPELIFHVRTVRTREQIQSTLDLAEHDSIYAVASRPDQIAAAMADPALTPIAGASLALFALAKSAKK